jgi:hypothetical protein
MGGPTGVQRRQKDKLLPARNRSLQRLVAWTYREEETVSVVFEKCHLRWWL